MRLGRAVTLALAGEAAIITAAAAALFWLAGWPRQFPGLALPLLGVLAAALAGMFYVGRRLTGALRRPLLDIASAARSGARGRFHSVPEGSFEEIREAIAAFNTMAGHADRSIALLELQKSTLESVLVHTSDALLVLDAQGSLTLVNPPAERIFGILEPLVIGHHLIEVLRHFELDALVRQVGRERAPLIREMEIHHPEHRLLRVQANPVVGREGEFLGTVIVAQDMTDFRHTELVRREFVANVSHELRTPLTSLRALAEALVGGAVHDREAGPRFLDRIIAEIDRLTLLVNDLLDLSAIESGSAKMEMGPVPLPEVVEDVITKFRPVADQHRITLREGPGNGLPSAWADRARLTQAVANLVDNAIKYTQEGGTVTIWGHERDDMVAISVADTGIGIPADHLSRIFERFYRVDRSRSRALGGTGLGLSIVKHIATSHGGRVEVQSTEGRGSCFTLFLPRVHEEASAGDARAGRR